eukprot:scaffold3733_cov175-Prasinococcus_capsulatus_cf.AAC.1
MVLERCAAVDAVALRRAAPAAPCTTLAWGTRVCARCSGGGRYDGAPAAPRLIRKHGHPAPESVPTTLRRARGAASSASAVRE